MLQLITPSLYNSYYFYRERELNTFEDFLNVLKKVPTPKTESMERGILFEDLVWSECEGAQFDRPVEDWMREISKEVTDIVKGGSWQVPVHKAREYFLYGRCDVIKRDRIFDIKVSSGYETGKFEYSIQHLLYMYCTGIKKFTYIDVAKKKTEAKAHVYLEDYFWDAGSEDLLFSRINDMVEFIRRDERLNTAFMDNWRARNG